MVLYLKNVTHTFLSVIYKTTPGQLSCFITSIFYKGVPFYEPCSPYINVRLFKYKQNM